MLTIVLRLLVIVIDHEKILTARYSRLLNIHWVSLIADQKKQIKC